MIIKHNTLVKTGWFTLFDKQFLIDGYFWDNYIIAFSESLRCEHLTTSINPKKINLRFWCGVWINYYISLVKLVKYSDGRLIITDQVALAVVWPKD